MKTARKVLIMALCAVLLVSATVMGTMAYLTARTETVSNTFTVGNVKFEDGEGKHGLDEAKVDEYGVPVSGAARVTENKYKLIPGHTYTKDPTIHMSSDTEDCYLFVEVVNQIAGLEATGNTIAAQMATLGWKPVTGVNNIYIYAGTATDATKTPVSAGTNVTVFNSFTLADDANVGTVDTANTAITIKAYAVQADGLSDKTPSQIWNAAFGE